MFSRLALLAGLSLVSFNSMAANDVYGTVSEITHRSQSAQQDHAVYVRLSVSQDATSVAECAQSPANLVWFLDLSSPVAQYQYDLLHTSYKEQLPVRVIGNPDVCADGPTDIDTIIEISPWSWPSIIEQRKTAPEVSNKFL